MDVFFVCFLLFIKKVKDFKRQKSKVPESFKWSCGKLSQVTKEEIKFYLRNIFLFQRLCSP